MPTLKKRILYLLLIIFLSGVAFSSLPVKNAQAQMATAATTIADIPRIIGQIGEKVYFFVQRAAKIVFKNSFEYFLQRVASDTATFLTTGDKGQKPLFWEQGVGTYLEQIGDEAIGSALDDIARDTFGVSLFEPYNANIKLQLILRTKQAFEPQRSTFSFNDILKNQLLNVTIDDQKPDLRLLDADKFNFLAQYFDPKANELGAGFILSSIVSTKRAKDTELALLVRQMETDVKSLTSPIGKLGFSSIKTPAIFSKETLGTSIVDAISGGQKTMTGDIVADAINTFTNSFASKFLQRLQKGILTGKGGATGGGPGDFGVGSSFGTRAADATFAEFIVPSFRGGGSVDVLGKLSSCPPENQARLFDNCIIDSRLATAIDQQLTVRQAIEQGYLDPNKPFGFLSDGSEPTYTNGYPYRSLVFMRKYRILPVTWELAALYIKDISNTNETFTLAQVMGTPADNFQVFNSTSSPFYHLVDPNWVLKLPEYECRFEGPGPQISQRVNISVATPDGFGGTITINEESLQRANYCADEQTCIVQNPNGTCQKYGYCTKERNTWNFQGQECLPQFSTCETYVKRATNNKTSYLATTMQTCDASQVGCRWYSMYKTAGGYWADDIWNQATNNFGTDNQITFGDAYNRTDLGDISYTRYFNNQVKTCSSKDEGCNKFIELTNISAPDGYEATTQSIFQYVQNNQSVYSEAGILNSYGEWGLIQEKNIKQAPSYLNCPTDINDPNRDSRCDDYAQSCSATEVGCSLYTPINGDPPVPAVLTNNDYCSAACVGYDQYLEVPTYFERRANPAASPVIENIIPASATSCRLSDVGCEQFTNLDEVAQGGEGIKYFNFIRECILPNDPAAKIFYTWEGSDTAGYQLKTWRLQSAGGGEPTGDSCDPANDPLNCRTFIDAEGTNWSIDIMTVTYATDDCHPFRRSVDSSVIYGIESFSRSCQAAAVGCKEYRGNQGNVVTIVVNDDFESGTSEGWINGFNSSESVYVGGHSMRLTGAQAHKRVNEIIRQGKNYTISFWARSSGASGSLAFEIQAYTPDQITQADNKTLSFIKKAKAQAIAYFEELVPIAGSQRSFGSVNLTDEWQYYRLGPVNFDRTVSAYEYLQTNATNVYIDNIIMREVTDSYYLIADSWETPAICNQPFPTAQLGCQAYRDTRGNQTNLLSFTALCSDSKVGCKALIDTNNSNSPFSQTYNTGNNVFSDPQGLDDVVVPADNIVYLVDDQSKYCASQFAGCTLAGEAIIDRQSAGAVVAFNDKFIIDSPENYNATMCGVGGLYCEQYISERTGSTAFLIDPGNRTCEYKLLPGRTAANWYQTGTEVSCPDLQTYPYQPVPQTDPNYDGWVGLCSPESMGCSQYIDPEGVSDVTKSSYFYLEQSVNTAACNGLVDRERGCRLFNKTDGTPQAFTPSAYATTTPDGSVPISSANAAENSANIILQVQKDRACDEWLYCKTRIQSYDSEGNRDDKCFDIGICDGLNDSGECASFPPLPNTEIVGQQISGATGYNTSYSVEDLRLMSGYTKAGMSWSGFSFGNGTTTGYLPYNLMTQIGNEANILYNPSFEDTITTNQPLQSPFPYWNTDNSNCNASSTCRVTPDKQSISGIRAAKFSINPNNSSAGNSSVYLNQALSLSPSEYILSGFIRWESIPTGNTSVGANIRILQGSNTLTQFGTRQDYSTGGWQPFSIKFTNTANNVTIRAELFDIREGTMFIDGLTILPALQVANSPETLLSQRCRLYPESSSPECNYVKGTKSYAGWPGFCAEVDPRNPSYCVNWWPVDIIKGSVAQINETPLIFEEKVPLYYCMQSQGRSSSTQTLFYNNDYSNVDYKYRVGRVNIMGIHTACAEDKTNHELYGNCNNASRDIFGNWYRECLHDIFDWAIGGCSNEPFSNLVQLDRVHNLSGDQSWAGYNLPERGLNQYEIEKIVLTKYRRNQIGGNQFPNTIVLTRDSAMRKSQLVGHGFEQRLADNISENEIIWGANCGYTGGVDRPVDGICDNGDAGVNDKVMVGVVFNNLGWVDKYYIYVDDNTGSEGEAIAYRMTYYLRESCLAIAQVAQVELNGNINTFPYWTRLSQFSGHNVTPLNYSYNTDSSPFGSVYQSGLSRYFQDGSNQMQNENNPSTWDSRPTESGNQPIYVEAENTLTINDGTLNPGPNIRAGTPYSCAGNCSTSICVGGSMDGTACIDDESAKLCYMGDGSNTGICVGSWQTLNPIPNTTYFQARSSLSQLFVKPLNVYSWQFDSAINNWRYHLLPEDPNLYWNTTGGGALPQIDNVLVNDDTPTVSLVDGGTVKLSFTTNIANDQLPLRSYVINWGDGSANTSVQGYFNERTSPGDPHVLYHSYSGTTTPAVNYDITITVTDNWDRVGTVTKSPSPAVCVGPGCP